jgi:hypothetical protein
MPRVATSATRCDIVATAHQLPLLQPAALLTPLLHSPLIIIIFLLKENIL